MLIINSDKTCAKCLVQQGPKALVERSQLIPVLVLVDVFADSPVSWSLIAQESFFKKNK